jgi:acyl carrier protein
MTKSLTPEDVSARIEKIIGQQIGDSTTPLSLEINLQEELGLDSLELVELGLTLEKEFNVSLSVARVRHCVTPGDIIQLVLHVQSEKEARSA